MSSRGSIILWMDEEGGAIYLSFFLSEVRERNAKPPSPCVAFMLYGRRARSSRRGAHARYGSHPPLVNINHAARASSARAGNVSRIFTVHTKSVTRTR